MKAALTLAVAQQIIDAALAHARKAAAQPLCVAVLDAGGHLITLAREDGASLLRSDIAVAKAAGALGMGIDSREIALRAGKNPAFFAAVAVLAEGALVPSAGGVLLRDAAGQLLGAVGVSGDQPDLDEACAMAGIEAMQVTDKSMGVRLRSIELVVPDAGKAAEFLTATWGLTKAQTRAGSTYLRGSGSFPYLVALEEGRAPAVRSVTFTCSSHELAAIEARVAATDWPATQVRSGDPGGGHGLLVQLPDGEIFRFLADGDEVAELSDEDQPVRLTHVVFNATDAEASARHVEQVLGFRVSDRTKAMVFVRCNEFHHSIAFARAGYPSLNHIAFEMKDIDAVMRGIGRLADHTLTPSWGPGRHGPGDNVFAYFIAPFGAVVEFSTAVEKLDERSHQVGAPEDWTWPPGRIDQWGISKKHTDALAVAERNFRFQRDWQRDADPEVPAGTERDKT